MAAFMDLEDEESLVSDDYYALLNISKKATKEEITSAYRRLSKVFHPDKHLDAAKKKDAEVMFNKVKTAYEVLLDPNKRQIYDRFGKKGLEIQGLEVITRTKSPAEIIAELDRYREEQEQRKLEQKTNPRGSVTVGVNATELFDRYQGYGDDEEEGGSLSDVEISNTSISQSVECPLTRMETATIAASLSNHNGRGQGSVTLMCRTTRKMNNKGWAEVDVTFSNGLLFGGKLFRNIGKRSYIVTSMALIPIEGGYMLQPSFSIMHQLSKTLMLKVTTSPFGIPTFMRTAIFYDSQQNYASCSIQIGLQSSYIQASYIRRFTDEESKLRVAAKYGNLGATVECGCEKRITQFSWLGASLVVGVPVGVLLRIKLVRGQQTFLVPIHLSEQVVPDAIFYGTMIPALIYTAAKKLIIDPYLKKQEEEDLEKKKDESAKVFAEKKKQAETAIELMKETVERIREVEENRKGLILVKGLYGKLTTDRSELDTTSCVEVTIPLQALVKDSKLVLHDRKSMSEIPGFYDPCPGEAKSLYIRYLFRQKLHQVTLQDTEAIRIPLPKHVIDDETHPEDTKT